MVEHGQHQRLQQDALGEGAFHDQHRGVRHERLTLGEALDVPAEAVSGQVVRGGIVHDPGVAQEGEFLGSEAERLKGLQYASGAGDHTEPAAGR